MKPAVGNPSISTHCNASLRCVYHTPHAAARGLSSRIAILAVLTLLLILAFFPGRSFAVDVPVEHPVYQYLERCDVRGLFEMPLSSIYPYSRRDVAALLMELSDKREELTELDRSRLQRYRFEFYSDLQDRGDEGATSYRPWWNRISNHGLFRNRWLFTNQRDMFAVEAEDWRFTADYLLGGSFRELAPSDLDSSELRERSLTYGFQASLVWGRWSLWGRATDSQVSYSRDQIDHATYPYQYNLSEDHKSFDFYDTQASIDYQSRHWLLYFGKGVNHWGPGQLGSFPLDRRSFPYTHFRANMQYGPIRGSIVYGKLYQFPRIVTEVDTLGAEVVRENYADKWMVAHRMEMVITRSLQLGLFEQVIYGERGFDPDYLHPFLFLRGAEHYTGDRDNLLVGFDIRWTLLKGLRLHTQFLFDEFSFSNLGSADFRNKHAWQVGGEIIDPLGIENVRIHTAYSRVRPYVYTHKYPVNVMQHYGVNLGLPQPPNSDLFSFEVRKQILTGLAVSFSGQRMRHGMNTDTENVGGDVRVSDRDGGSEEAPFLEGDLLTESRISFAVECELVYDLSARLMIAQVWRNKDVQTLDGKIGREYTPWTFSIFWKPYWN